MVCREDSGHLYFGWSKAMKKEKIISKKWGRDLAERRSFHGPLKFDEFPYIIKENFDRFSSRVKKVYQSEEHIPFDNVQFLTQPTTKSLRYGKIIY